MGRCVRFETDHSKRTNERTSPASKPTEIVNVITPREKEGKKEHEASSQTADLRFAVARRHSGKRNFSARLLVRGTEILDAGPAGQPFADIRGNLFLLIDTQDFRWRYERKTRVE